MNDGTRIFSTIPGFDALSSRLQDPVSPSSTASTQTSEPFLPTDNVNNSTPHPTFAQLKQENDLDSRSENKTLQKSTFYKSTMVPSSFLSSKLPTNNVSQKLNGHHRPSPFTHSNGSEKDLPSPKSKPSALKPVKIRPIDPPTIRSGNGFTETIFQIPSPVPSQALSWGSEEHLPGVRDGNSNTSSPAKVSIVSSATLPLENGVRSESVSSSKASFTNCLPLRLTSDSRSKLSPTEPGTPRRDQTITGILKTPTKSATIFSNPLNSSSAIKSGVETGPTFTNTDFSSTQSLKVFATTLSGGEMFNETRRFSDRDVDRANGDKTSSVLLNSANKLNSGSTDLSESRGVTFQADQMSHVFSRFKVLFDGNEPPPADKLEGPDKESVIRRRSSHEIAQKPRGSIQGVPNSDTENSDQHNSGFLPVTIRTGLCRCANLSTKRGRRNHALMIMLVSVVPVIALLIQNSIDVYGHGQELNLHNTVKREILFSMETGNVIHRTQIERGTTALYISSKGDAKVWNKLQKAYAETDNVIQSLTQWGEEPDISYFKTVDTYYSRIKSFRAQIAQLNMTNITVPDVIKFYSDDNDVIIRWVGRRIQYSKSSELWKTLMGYYMLILSKEQAGVERALGSTFYAQGGFDRRQMFDYLERKILGKSYLDRCQENSIKVKIFLQETYLGGETDRDVERMREEILFGTLNGSDVEAGTLWFSKMTQFLNVLKDVQDQLAVDTVNGLEKEMENMTDALVESLCVMVVALILFPLVIIAVYRLTNRIQAYAQTLQERTRDLDIERKRSETLLFELLPVSVAQMLLNHQDVPPVSYPAVTVFFSDIVGFTNICSRSTPMQVIDMLNCLYRMFDDIIDTFDVYKVETIGDAYMVASGLPRQNVEGHASEMAAMALEVRAKLSEMTVSHLDGESLRMRIGMNSGPVVAGVVGHKMPRYCLFGDTVNVASRMESTSLPLKIQVAESTKWELDKTGGFVLTMRGQVDIKGKGQMTTYWLEASAPNLSYNGN